MTRPDPAETVRRALAVSTVRRFTAIYAAFTFLLFVGPLARTSGLPAPTGVLQAVLSGGALLGLIVTGAWLIVALTGLGQYRIGRGLKFDFWAAVLRGEYEGEAGETGTSPEARRTPLELLRADVLSVHPELVRLGQVQLGETVLSALSEAEAVARLIEVFERRPQGMPLDSARAAIGRYGDHVVAVRNALATDRVDAVEHLARFEADLNSLRNLGDQLRVGTPREATG